MAFFRSSVWFVCPGFLFFLLCFPFSGLKSLWIFCHNCINVGSRIFMKFDIMKRKYLIRLIMVCKDFIGCLFSFVNKNFVQFVLFSFFGGWFLLWSGFVLSKMRVIKKKRPCFLGKTGAFRGGMFGLHSKKIPAFVNVLTLYGKFHEFILFWENIRASQSGCFKKFNHLWLITKIRISEFHKSWLYVNPKWLRSCILLRWKMVKIVNKRALI